MAGPEHGAAAKGLAARAARGAALLAGGVALLAGASPALAQTQPQAQQLGLRSTDTTQDARSILNDPRTTPASPSFGTMPPPPLGPGAGLPQGADPSATQGPAGGATARRQASRASRPVQGRVSGGAQGQIRPIPRQVARLPNADPATSATGSLRLRPTAGATRIVTPAPDGLQPQPSRRPSRTEEDPWAPTGLRLGTIVVTPSITQFGGYDTNPDRVARDRKPSAVLRTEGEIAARSDWSIHSFTANLRGGYNIYTQNRDANRPDLTGASNLRLNLSRDTDIDWDLRAGIDTQRPGSPNFNAVTTERPLTYAYGTSLGATHRINRLVLNLRGSVDRSTFDDATDSLGTTIIQRDRNATQYGLRLRAGYEVTPGLTPFIEAAADRRIFDQTVDISGFRRASTGYTGRAGAAFEITRLLTGEASVGYQLREYADGRLGDLKGVVGDAALIWTATPLTTVTLRGATDLADTTIPGVSGSTNRRFTLEIAHALRRNWIVTGFGGLSRTAFGASETQGALVQGSLVEDIWQVGLRSDYKFTRNVSLRASYVYERLNANRPGSGYDSNVFLLGLRLQL